GPGRCCSGVFGQAGKQSSVERCLEIEHFITDRDAAARSFPKRAEYAERKILDGKLGVAVRRSDPAAAPGIMWLVNEVRHRTASGLITLTGLPRAYAITREWYPEGRVRANLTYWSARGYFVTPSPAIASPAWAGFG